jgi:hypothetical protein
MTATDKPVQRVTQREYMVLFPHNKRKARRIVTRIDQGDILRFREHGRRQWFDLNIDEAMRLAVKARAGFVVCMVPGPALRKKKGRTR